MNYEDIIETIKRNPLYYIGYFELGKYLEDSNPKQAYLCYENALFYVKDEKIKKDIQSNMDRLIASGNQVEPTSIVILSYNLKDLTKQCIESIRETTPSSAREIVVVDNASKDDSVQYLRQQEDIVLVANEYNAGFPGGCNIGIKASKKKNDIFLLNNDTLLCANALFTLRMALYEKENYGAAGCSTSNCINGQSIFKSDSIFEMKKFGLDNNIPTKKEYEHKLVLVGFAMLIKRHVLEQIGYLDERYFPGNKEDEDLSLRILQASYQNIFVSNSYIIHLGGQSFDKTDRQKILLENIYKFNKKFEFSTDPYFLLYTGGSPIRFYESLIENVEKPSKILEIDCEMGCRLLSLKALYPQHDFYGLDKSLHAAVYSSNIDNVHIQHYSNIETNIYSDDKFDFIALDTTKLQKEDLDRYIQVLSTMLSEDGVLYIRVKNIGYHAYWYPIVKEGKIPQELNDNKTIFNIDLDPVLMKYGLKTYGYILGYIFPTDENVKKEIEEVGRVLNKNNMFISLMTYGTRK